MTEGHNSDLLDDGRFPEAPSWQVKEWVPVVSDRAGDFGAVTCIQRVTAQTFFSMTSVYLHEGGRWSEVFENGHEWPIDPREPRPANNGFVLLTNVSGAGAGEDLARFAFVAGVVSADVATVRVASVLDGHELAVNARTGTFVALSLQPQDSASFELVALDARGDVVDRVDYADPWSRGT
jgi:hypothetical protein